MCQISPLCPSRSTLLFTTLLSVPNISQLQKVPMTPLSLANSEPWRLEGRWRVRWGHVFPQFLPYRVYFIHSTQGYSSLQLGSGNLPPFFRPWSGSTSALLVLGSSLTPCVLLHTAHTFIKLFIKLSMNYPNLNTPSMSCWNPEQWGEEPWLGTVKRKTGRFYHWVYFLRFEGLDYIHKLIRFLQLTSKVWSKLKEDTGREFFVSLWS